MASFRKTVTLALCFALASAPSLNAGGCGVFFNHHKVVAAVPVYAAIPVYQVGTDLEIKAAVEKALREREQASQAQQKALRAVQQQNWEAERPAQPEASRTQLVVLQAKCGSCHATPNSTYGYKWAMSDGLTDRQFFLTTGWVAGKFPPPKQMESVLASLKPGDHAKLLDELFALKMGESPQVSEGSVQY